MLRHAHSRDSVQWPSLSSLQFEMLGELTQDRLQLGLGFPHSAQASTVVQLADRTSACSSTVKVAFSCLSGG
jgi:hypothetical protein